MKTVSIHDAKTNLSKYIAAAKRGEKIAIGAYGKEEVWLTNVRPQVSRQPQGQADMPLRQFGTLKGKITIPEDFDDPDKETLAAIEKNEPKA